jgi:hypothetical protein
MAMITLPATVRRSVRRTEWWMSFETVVIVFLKNLSLKLSPAFSLFATRVIPSLPEKPNRSILAASFRPQSFLRE